MKNWILVGLGGLISGLLSGVLSTYLIFDNFDIWPGIFFGTLFVIVAKHLFGMNASIARKIIFIIFSILAYIGAFWAAFYAAAYASPHNSGLSQSDFYVGIFVGGVVGALIFLLAIKLFFNFLKFPQILLLVIISGFLGVGASILTVSYSSMIESEGAFSPFLGLFTVWQIGMILSIYYFLNSNVIKNSPKNLHV